MTTRILKPVYLIDELGELGRLPDGAIVNIGGVEGPSFTVAGRGLLFDDGSSTSPGGVGGFTLQVAYTNSTAPATINLTAGKNFVLNSANNKKLIFNADTGSVVIEGDLAVLGDSSVIEGSIYNVNQVNIAPPDDVTTALNIEPISFSNVDLVTIRAINGDPPVFRIDNTGVVRITEAVIDTLNGVAVQSLVDHLDTNTTPAKHAASQISVAPLTNLLGDDVQEVLESIDFIIGAGGVGSVTSVAISSFDLTVTGSPITSSGTISLELNVVPISKGGTGATTAADAINALVPPQTGNAGKVLTTDGNNVSWVNSAAVTGGLFFIDAAPTASGIVGNRLFVPGTVPANKVIYEATTDTDNVTVQLFAEGGSAFYSPTVTVTTVPPQVGGPITASLVEDPADKRSYSATAALTGITVDTVVTAFSSTGAVATMTLVRALAGPSLTSLLIGPLPGSQTAAKQGDVITVTGLVENTATYAEILAAGASGSVSALTVGGPDSGGPGYRTLSGSFTVGNLTGVQSIQARARNSLGTYGSNFSSTNSITLDQVYPVIGARTISYPGVQLALKSTETATVSATITNADTYSYTATNLSVLQPTTYTVAKSVTRTGGTYSYGVNNYTITATRSANNATAVASAAVAIAAVAPTAVISIVGNPTRLRSSPTGLDYTITITADQRLLSAPMLTASSGTWQGAGWSGSGTTWTRVLRISDSDPKGAQTFSGLSMTGLAGIIGTVITAGSAYNVGGFPLRTITFPAFAQFAPIGTTVADFSKVSASYTGASTLTRYSDTAQHFQGFTITDGSGNFDPNGGYLFISDAAFAGSNTTGTLQLDIEEVA